MQLRKIEANTDLFQVAPPYKRGEAAIRVYNDRRQQLPANPEFVRLDGLVKSLFERKGTIALCALVGVGLAFLAALLQKPVYEAKVSLEIQGFNENFLNRRDVDPTADASNYAIEPYLQTQIKLLQTDALIGRVADRLHLDQRPEFQTSTSNAGAIARWFPSSKASIGSADKHPGSRREQLVRKLASNLNVRLSGQTRIVEVLFEDANPALTADFANTLADEFISQTLDRRVSATQHTGKWLTKQLKELKATLEDSEQNLHNYVAANGLLFTSEKDSVAEANLRQLQGALLSAHEARVAEQSKYDLATASPLATTTDDLDSETLRAYHLKLTDLRRELAESRAVLTPAHYKVKQIQAQISELQSAVEREQRSILERLRKSYESTKWREQMLHDDYGRQMEVVTRQSAKEVAYNTLKREVDGNRLLYEATLQKVKEADVASAIRANNIQVVDPAKAPEKPLKPSKPMYCAVGLLSGSLFGIGLVFFLERTDRRMRTPAEVRRCLDVPQLGAIPAASIDLPHSAQSLSWPGFRRGDTHGGAAPLEPDSVLRNWLELVTWRQRESALAESFRAVLASLLFSGAERESRVIVITSACASEGKTTVACNLAVALAETGQKVLIIDADRRRPRLHEVFKVSNRHGFFDLLNNKATLYPNTTTGLTYRTDIPGLYVLPSGELNSETANIVGNQSVEELLNRFRGTFDVVLIDTPPVLALSDARALGRSADGVALVIRANSTPHDAAFAAWQRLSEDGISVLGTILNNWDSKNSPDYTYAPSKA